MPAAHKPRLGTRNRPEQTRAAILDAAMREFAHEGVAGARTEAIARAARVNKALLYYYFKDKEALYGAVIDRVFSGLSERISEALARDLPVRERYLAYVGAHFDYVAGNPTLPRIFMREWMRTGRSTSPHLRRIAEQYLRPNFAKISHLLAEGVASGDFRPVNPADFIPSTVAMVVFYFTSTPVMSLLLPGDPLAPERIAQRRAAVLHYVSAILFTDQPPAHAGERL
jgi:TetR/AcrR family transcriptional regulator